MTQDEFYQWRTCADTALILGVSGRTVRRAVDRGDMLSRPHEGSTLFMPVDCPWTQKTLAVGHIVIEPEHVQAVSDNTSNQRLDVIDENLKALRIEVERLRKTVESNQSAPDPTQNTTHTLSFVGLVVWVWSWLKVKLDHIRRTLG